VGHTVVEDTNADPKRNEILNRLYLDHASTSWPKADGVIEAITQFMHECGASASRGNYAAARAAGGIVARTRQRLATEIGCNDPACVSFHPGCTAALNVAIAGLLAGQLSPDTRVIASSVEHNAVLRPLHAASQRVGAELHTVPTAASGRVNVDAIAGAIDERTRLIALSHASNVTGIVQPVAELGQIIAEQNASRDPTQQIILLCDAAQTFGYLPIDVTTLGVHALAAPAHKGSGGPVGIAMLYLHPSLHDIIEPTIHGGSGHDGLAETMPTAMPGRLEPGTLNVPAIAGWQAALNRPVADPQSISKLATYLHDGLAGIEGVRVVGDRGELPIASLDFGSLLSSAEAAAILDGEFQIDVRSGYHCAARLHDCLGTRPSGTLRVSGGHTTTHADIDRFLAAVAEIAADSPGGQRCEAF